MFKEYKTITEAVGPLMVVNGVEGVTYNELVDIIGATAKSEEERFWKSTATRRSCNSLRVLRA